MFGSYPINFKVDGCRRRRAGGRFPVRSLPGPDNLIPSMTPMSQLETFRTFLAFLLRCCQDRASPVAALLGLMPSLLNRASLPQCSSPRVQRPDSGLPIATISVDQATLIRTLRL